MTSTFNPKVREDPTWINDKYLSPRSEGTFSTTEKKFYSLSSWWIGKMIHWIFQPHERISRVREVYQSLCDDQKNISLGEATTLYVNASYFNDRVIKRHNDHWICSILFWSKIPLLDTTKLKTHIETECYNITGTLQKADYAAENLSDFNLTLEKAQRAANILNGKEPLKSIGQDLQKVIDEQKTQYTKSIDCVAERIAKMDNLTPTDFTILDQLLELCNQKDHLLGVELNLDKVKPLVIAYGTELQSFDAVFNRINNTNIKPNAAEVADNVRKVLDLKYVSPKRKIILSVIYQRLRLFTCQASDLPQLRAELNQLEDDIKGHHVSIYYDELFKMMEQLEKIQACVQKCEDSLVNAKSASDVAKIKTEIMANLYPSAYVTKEHPVIKEAETRIDTLCTYVRACRIWIKQYEMLQQENANHIKQHRWDKLVTLTPEQKKNYEEFIQKHPENVYVKELKQARDNYYNHYASSFALFLALAAQVARVEKSLAEHPHDFQALDAIVEESKNQPFYEALKAYVVEIKFAKTFLDPIHAVIKKYENGESVETPRPLFRRDYIESLDPENKWRPVYDELDAKFLLICKAFVQHHHSVHKPHVMISMARSCAEDILTSEQLATIEDIAPNVAKRYRACIEPYRKGAEFNTKLKKVLQKLKEMKEHPDAYRKTLSLYYWIDSKKDSYSLRKEIAEIHAHPLVLYADKLNIQEASKGGFPEAFIKNDALLETCAKAWKSKQPPQFTAQEVALITTLVDDSNLPLQFTRQLYLLLKMQEMKVHPRALLKEENAGIKPEELQLILQWSALQSRLHFDDMIGRVAN